ncbi:unnamed protein product [Caenorhabditis sp. 36 PRJEB53466]|nr:unnamed protein product [Caenorhabditis sp. 36 PRJEB53466]
MAIVKEIVEGEQTQLEKVETLKKEGNALFGKGEFEKANEKYTEAISECPPTSSEIQSILFSNSAAALIKQNKWTEAVEAATKAIEMGATNEKALERRAFAHSNIREKYEDAIEDYRKLEESIPSRKVEFERKIGELNAKIMQRNEEMKADMIEKLKSLGNMCLSPFGLSTDSFEMVPNGSGGFSVQMKGNNQKKEEEDA